MAIFNLNSVFPPFPAILPLQLPQDLPQLEVRDTPKLHPWTQCFWAISPRVPSPKLPTLRGLSHAGCIHCLDINLIKPHPPTQGPISPHSGGWGQQSWSRAWGEGLGGQGRALFGGGGCTSRLLLAGESALVAMHQHGLGTGSVKWCSLISEAMPPGGCSPISRVQPPVVMDPPHARCDALPPPRGDAPPFPRPRRCHSGLASGQEHPQLPSGRDGNASPAHPIPVPAP